MKYNKLLCAYCKNFFRRKVGLNQRSFCRICMKTIARRHEELELDMEANCRVMMKKVLDDNIKLRFEVNKLLAQMGKT